MQWKMPSELGDLYLVASDSGLRGVFFEPQPGPVAKNLRGKTAPVRILAQAARELGEYFQGERRSFSLPLDLQGTRFQKRVWNELTRIPYGQTCSYGDVARRLRKQKAFRAVGSANGKNPACIIVPCHRVIASDGSIGGYSGGLRIKTQLLALEDKTVVKAGARVD